jgi:GT2 family glycosyltransferase
VSDAAPQDGEVACPDTFDEAVYLELNPDVAGAVAAGAFPSGRAHFVRFGAREGRRYLPTPGEVREPGVIEIVTTRPDGSRPPPPPAYWVEAVRMSPGGGVFVTGWIDDATDPLVEARLRGEDWEYDLVQVSLARIRRRDVESRLGVAGRHPYGFWSFVDLGRAMRRHAACRLTLLQASGAGVTLEVGVRSVADSDLRDAVLAWLVDSDWGVSAHIGAVAGLAGGAGAQIVAHNRRITEGIVARPEVERFGTTGGRPKASLIVCLYGRPEYLFLQNALFAGGAGMDEYEFVYVCNSPELADRLARDARIGSLVHGTRQTLVLLPANAGFGAANNVGARFASSDRLIACNPDVFPYHADWARRHTEVVEHLPAARTALFGVPLFYETGALMHGGMFFQIDTVRLTRPGGLFVQELVRVQHYGKGAPPDTASFLRPRPVPAVTGAFISCRRDWFERLGGFSEDFVFGHYEDADLCLRSIEAGVAPWLHDIRMYHLEGAGSSRARAQEGALFVNRWLFATRWAATIRAGLHGAEPSHPLLAEPPAVAPTARRKRR